MLDVIFFIAILIFSVIVHEVAHGWVALALGDPTAKDAGRLTLNPIPHIDLLGSIIIPTILVLTASSFLFGWAKPVPYNPYNVKYGKWGEALVALGGPGINIFMAISLCYANSFWFVCRCSDVPNILIYSVYKPIPSSNKLNTFPAT